MPELRMLLQRRMALLSQTGRILTVPVLAFALLHAGCTPLGAAQLDQQSASMESFLNSEQLSRKAPSHAAEVIFAQLKMSQALGENDLQSIRESRDELLRLAAKEQGLNSSGALMDAAIWLLTNEHGAEAKALADKALHLMPDDLPLAALKADLLIQEDRTSEAISLLKSFAGRHPDDAKAQAELALALLRSGEPSEAMSVFSSIPDGKLTPQIRFAYAQALNTARKIQEAEKQLRQAVKEEENFSEAWQLLALTLEDMGQHKEAMSIYSRLLSTDPDNRSARLFLLRGHLLSGHMDDAVAVVKESSEPLRFAVAASAVLMEEKQVEKTESLLERLEKLPEMPAALYFYHAALLFENGGNPERMLGLLALVPNNCDEYDRAMRMKVQLLYDLKREAEALEAVEIVRQLNPNDAEPLILKSELLVRLKQLPEAEKTLKEALAAHPNNEKLCFQFAYLHEIKGERKEAMRLMEDVVLRFPENALALNFVGYNLADSGKELERALTLIRKAAELEPEADFITDSLAWVCYRLGRYDEAWEFIQRAVHLSQKSNNEDPTMLEHYGDIALTQNEREGARLAYKASLELFLKHNLKNDAQRVHNKLKKL